VEFSLFLVLASILFRGFFYTGRWVLFPLFSKTGSYKNNGTLSTDSRLLVLQAVFSCVIILVSIYYLGRLDLIWGSISDKVFSVYNSSEVFRNSRGLEVYTAVKVFNSVYPSALVFIAAVWLLYWLDRNRRTFWYRFLKGFDHKQVIPATLLWTLTGIINQLHWKPLNWNIEGVLLNLSIFFSAFYVLFGFLTLVYGLKKSGWNSTIAAALIYLIIVVSGEFFPFTLTLILGIGVSDIWMNYRNRKFKKRNRINI
jgi:hypothetical protein